MGRGSSGIKRDVSILDARLRNPGLQRNRTTKHLLYTDNVDVVVEQTGYELHGEFVLHSFDDQPAQRCEFADAQQSTLLLWIEDGVLSRPVSDGPAFVVDTSEYCHIIHAEHGQYKALPNGYHGGKIAEKQAGVTEQEFASYRNDLELVDIPNSKGVKNLWFGDEQPKFHSFDDRPSFMRVIDWNPEEWPRHAVHSSPEVMWHENGVMSRENGPAQLRFHLNGIPESCAWIKAGKYVFDPIQPNVITFNDSGEVETCLWLEGEYPRFTNAEKIAVAKRQKDGTFKWETKSEEVNVDLEDLFAHSRLETEGFDIRSIRKCIPMQNWR